MQFSLPTTRATLSSINCRSELHGSDHVPAVDLGFTLTLSNTVLDTLGCGPLRKMFYTKGSGDSDGQGTLDGVAAITDTPNLRSQDVSMPIRLGKDFSGYTVVVVRGLGDAISNITLGDCKVNKLSLDMMPGGSIELAVRVQKSGIDSGQLGPLLEMLGSETDISLAPPTLQEQAKLGEAA